VTDSKPPGADVVEFVGRGVSAQNGADAAIVGACVGFVRAELLTALALVDRDRGAAAVHARQALHELATLEARLLEHFGRLGVRRHAPPPC
jgi:hypothetical protein